VKLGIFEAVFGKQNLASLQAVREHGFHAVQLDLGSVGLETLPETIPDDVMPAIRGWSDETGVRIAGMQGTFNMIDPNLQQRQEGLRRLVALVEAAPQSGTRIVTLCTGTRNPDSMWRHHPDNDQPGAWQDLRATLDVALEAAERADIILGVEPEPANVVSTAALGRRLLDEVGSPHLGIIADPANMLLGMDVSRPVDSLRQAFDVIGPDIVMAHGKDLRADRTFAAVGTGIVPWRHVKEWLDQAGFDDPLILHGLGAGDIDRAKRTLAGAGFEA
jgi:sugar phosphate isomerase/epimerase